MLDSYPPMNQINGGIYWELPGKVASGMMLFPVMARFDQSGRPAYRPWT
jgi:hypothetical protein